MYRFIFAAIVILTSSASYADLATTGWKKENPNELAYFAFADDHCSFTSAKVAEITESALIRARIKALGGIAWAYEPMHLFVAVSCTRQLNQTTTYLVIVKVGDYSSAKPIFLQESKRYGVYGVGRRSQILSDLRGALGDQITYYLKANFDHLN